jgi:small subunit ribosomal protein S5
MAEETTQTKNNDFHSRDRKDNSEKRSGRGGRGGRGRGKKSEERQPKEFEQKILDLARVTRVTAGGKRMSFRCALVIGDKKGRVGFGVAKGGDVQMAIEKAYRQAKKGVFNVVTVNDTIPHPVQVKFGSAIVFLKPAPKGTGLKAGGAARIVFEYAGIPNIVSKIKNSNNKINIAKGTLDALRHLACTKIDEKHAEQKMEATEKLTVAETGVAKN